MYPTETALGECKHYKSGVFIQYSPDERWVAAQSHKFYKCMLKLDIEETEENDKSILMIIFIHLGRSFKTTFLRKYTYIEHNKKREERKTAEFLYKGFFDR